MTARGLQARAGRALGSPLRLTVAGGVAPRLVDAAWDAVTDEFAAVDRAMSRFRPDSELTAVHAAGGRAWGPSRRLRTALAAAERARRITGGRFDPRVVRHLERLGSPGLPQPWDGRPAAVAGPTPVVCADGRAGTAGHVGLRLSAPVDLGGIGKGLALRWAGARARTALAGTGPSDVAAGRGGYLLEAGGDVVAEGLAGGRPWSIAIEDPEGASEPVAAVRLAGGMAIATSSVRLGRWVAPDGRAVHHLIDPRTGEPAGGGLLAVTVAAADPAWAEVWSKSLFVEGAPGIAELARRHGLAAWWVGENGSLAMTPAARAMTFWVRAEATVAAAR